MRRSLEPARLANSFWRGAAFAASLHRFRHRVLLGLRRRAEEGRIVVLAAERAKGVGAARVEQNDEFVGLAIGRLADEGYRIGLAVDGQFADLTRDAVEILVELDEPVGRRLDELHQLVPGRMIGRLAVQRVEQEFGFRGLGKPGYKRYCEE